MTPIVTLALIFDIRLNLILHGIIDRKRYSGIAMSDPIISPDGKLVWTGNDWVPLPVSSPNTNIQDSVIMGDLNTNIDNSVHNTYTQDSEKMVRSHLRVVADNMRKGLFFEAEKIYEKAKQIDYNLSEDLYNGEFVPIFVDALWKELSSHHGMDVNQIANRIQRIFSFDENHIPSLVLLAEVTLYRNNTAPRFERLKLAESSYMKILSIEPNNVDGKMGIMAIQRMRKMHSMIRIFGIGLIAFFIISVV